MISSQVIFVAILIITMASFIFDRWLALLNIRNIKPEVPELLKVHYDSEKYIKSQQYLRDNSRISAISSTVSFALLITALVAGFFPWLDALVRQWSDNPIWQTMMFFAALALISGLMSLPFSVYFTFVIEEKYGFNRTSVRTFVLDTIKSAILASVLGGGALILITWIYLQTGQWFWLYAWMTATLLSLLMTLLYSDLIVPLFNKQKPLEEGALRNEIFKYGQQNSFRIRDIYVIDGSKRSSKANAYFTGFGPRKRIVLYDTLIQDHTQDELIAILAHEVGHYKHRHVLKGFLMSTLVTGITLFLLSLFIQPGSESAAVMAGALGAQPSFYMGVLVFGILYSPLSTLTSFLSNVLSRKHEFQADAFAGKTFSAQSLADALIRLSVKHLSNLYPHPWYMKVHYSHPPLLQRLAALGIM